MALAGRSAISVPPRKCLARARRGRVDDCLLGLACKDVVAAPVPRQHEGSRAVVTRWWNEEVEAHGHLSGNARVYDCVVFVSEMGN